MAEKKPRSESWRVFVFKRFFPYFWADFQPRFNTTMLAILAAVLVLAAQLHFGVIGSNGIRGRELATFGPYAVLMVLFAIYHAVRTPWLISNDQLDSIKASESARGALQRELESLKQVPPVIAIHLREIYRNPSQGGKDRNEAGEMSWNVFLSTRAELEAPLSAEIQSYTFQLSLHGKTISIPSEGDVDSWKMTIWHHVRVTSTDLLEMPKQLKKGLPLEGWLHFVVGPITHQALDACSIRLIADTGISCSYGECGADPLVWNPVKEKSFSRKT